MRKMIIANAIIPILSIVFMMFESITIKGQRLISIKYRLWMFEYGFLLIFVQLIILIITFFIWKERKNRLVAFVIFLIWIFIGFFISKEISLFD